MRRLGVACLCGLATVLPTRVAGAEAGAPSNVDARFFVSTPAAPSAASALRRAGLGAVRTLGRRVVTFSGDGARAGRALRASAIDARVSPDFTRRLFDVPNDPQYASQWNLNGVNGPNTGVRAGEAWSVTHGSSSIVVADIDTGIDGTHPDLAGKLVTGYNALQDTPLAAGNTDAGGHGTAVAGVIGAATDNGSAIAALGWATKLMAIKAGGSSGLPDSAIAAGLIYAADHGVRIVNMSFGGADYSPGLADAVAYAQARGVLLVAAAGNDATSGDEYPAAFPGVIGVGATGYNGLHATYSNTGSQVDLVAPGGSADGNPSHDILVLRASGTTTTSRGTSFASPTVAAAAALVLARNPALQPFQAGPALVHTAADLGSSGPDPIYGAGLLDAAAAAQAASTIASAPGPVVHRGGAWYLRSSLSFGVADTSFSYGNATDVGLVCDWYGDGTRTAGVFRGGAWYLRNAPGGGLGGISFRFGDPGDIPICGDWNRDGIDTPGVVRGDTWYLRNSNTTGIADIAFKYGNPGDIPIVGDWNGDGDDTPGIVRAGVWYLRNSTTGGNADVSFAFGNPSDTPVVGDWDGNRTTNPAVFRNGTWYLRASNTTGAADLGFGFGDSGDKPLTAS